MRKWKRCSKCGMEKPVTSEFYYRAKQNDDGYYGQCKVCTEEVKRVYRENNKEKIYKDKREWNRRNPNIIRKFNQDRRARLRGLEFTLSQEDWRRVMKRFNNSCAYCGLGEEQHMEEYEQQLHQEHFIPLSKGGEYTHNNIIPSCIICNTCKHNKDFFEWYPGYEHYNQERESDVLKFLGYTKGKQQLALFK